MLHAQTRNCPRKSYPKNPLEFKVKTDHHVTTTRPFFVVINEKKRTCLLVDFAVPEDHIVEIKKSENHKKHLDLIRESKNKS